MADTDWQPMYNEDVGQIDGEPLPFVRCEICSALVSGGRTGQDKHTEFHKRVEP